MREHKGPPARRAKGGTDNDWPTGKTYRDSRHWCGRRGEGETKKERERLSAATDVAACEGCIMGLRREWPFQSLLRVTEVAPRVCGANGKATPTSTGCSVNSQRYTFPRSPSRKLVRLWADKCTRARARADVPSVLENLANFESIFPRWKFDWPPSRFAKLFNFQYYISCEPELGLKFWYSLSSLPD